MDSFSAAIAPELSEIARRLDGLQAGDLTALAWVRTTLQRAVVSPRMSAKPLLVQALLLLDDPRILESHGGSALLAKVRKLVTVAAQVDAATPPDSASPPAQVSPDAMLSPDIDRSLVEEFVVEAREQLGIAEGALLVLDSYPDDTNALEGLFRALHSIKGTSAFLGIEHATNLAHHAESLLDDVRAGSAPCSRELSNLVFRSIDMLDSMLVAIEQASAGETVMIPEGYRDLVAELRAGPSSDAPNATTPRNSGQLRRLAPSEMSVRVRAADLDRLASTVRDLVATHAMLARDASLRSNPDVARKTAFAERLAFELEDLATELRTVAFGFTLQKVARMARDGAYQSGKSLSLLTEGRDVLVERVMADALADPLMHMVRNVIDHALETPEEREKLGKPSSGLLRISAQRDGDALVIELSDDGRGIDPQHLVQVAIERGFLLPGAHISEEEAMALVFRHGFSTARVATALSGRGVGMDVVRTNVDAIGGSINIASRIGVGTTFTIRLPFRTPSERGASSAWVDSQRAIELSA